MLDISTTIFLFGFKIHHWEKDIAADSLPILLATRNQESTQDSNCSRENTQTENYTEELTKGKFILTLKNT